MKRLFFWVYFLGLMVGPVTGFAAPMNLEDVVRYALEHSPSLDTAKRQKAIATDNVSNAWASFLPSLDLSNTNAWEGSTPSTQSSPWNGSLGLSLTQNFYLNHSNLIQKRISEFSSSVAEVELERKQASLIQKVLEAYYSFSLNTVLLDVQTEQHKLVNKQFISVSRQYQQGLKTRMDFLRFKSALRRAELTVLSSGNSIKRSVADLKKLIGVPMGSPLMEFRPLVTKKIEVQEIPVGEINIKQHYDYLISDLQNKAQAERTALVERTYWPQLSVVGQAGYLNNDYYRRTGNLLDGDSLSWSVGLNLKFNLWDWGILRRKVAVARNEQEIINNKMRDTVLELRATLKKLLLDLGQLKESYAISQELLELEEKSFKQLERDYRQGKVLFVDLIRGLDTLNSARTNFYRVYFNVKTSISQYRFHARQEYEISN